MRLRLFRELRRGSTKLLVLSRLEAGPMYGYEILRAIREGSGRYFDLSEGALYPALHALEKQGLLRGAWREVDGRSRKYYDLTPRGRRFLAEALREWQSFSTSFGALLRRRETAGVR